MSSQGLENAADAPVRLDKWLWAARLFKSRALAAAAIQGGKVHLNGARVKPAHSVRPADIVTIRRGDAELTLQVRALATRRGPARTAATLYEETPESQAARISRAAMRAQAAHSPRPDTRPSKKDRRALTRLTQRNRNR
jgi:ribosome-associated heat shock protein Hsp15